MTKRARKPAIVILAMALIMQLSFPVAGLAEGTTNGAAAPDTNVTPATGPSTIPNAPNIVSVKYPVGWNMVSLPGNTDLGAELFTYDSLAVAYKAVTSTVVGVGYWAYFSKETTVTMMASTVSDVPVTLQSGWNMVGNPFGSDVALPSGYQGYAYDSAARRYAITNTIPAGYGVWVFAMAPAEITLHNPTVKKIVEPVTLDPITTPGAGGSDTTTDSESGDTAGSNMGADARAALNPDGPTVNVKDFGAKGDNSANDTSAIQSAVKKASRTGGTVYFPKGTYRVTSIRGASNVLLKGEDGATLVSIGGTFVVSTRGGKTSTTTKLDARASKGDAMVAFSSASGFSVGDIVLLGGDNVELNRIKAVSGSSVAFERPLTQDYSSAAEVVKLAAIYRMGVQNLTISIPDNGGGILMGLGYESVVDKVAITGPDRPGITFSESAYCEVTNSTVKDGKNINSSGRGYGIQFANSTHNSVIRGNYCQNIREIPITTRARNILVEGNVVDRPYDDGINTHGYDVQYVDIVNNTITNSKQYGIAVGWSGHWYGDKHVTVRGNRIENAAHDAIIVNAPADKRNEDVKVIGNTVINCGSSASILTKNTDNVEVASNKVLGNSGVSYGIYALNGSTISITGNSLQNLPKGYGVAFKGVRSVLVEGNTFSNVASNIGNLGSNLGVAIK